MTVGNVPNESFFNKNVEKKFSALFHSYLSTIGGLAVVVCRYRKSETKSERCHRVCSILSDVQMNMANGMCRLKGWWILLPDPRLPRDEFLQLYNFFGETAALKSLKFVQCQSTRKRKDRKNSWKNKQYFRAILGAVYLLCNIFVH